MKEEQEGFDLLPDFDLIEIDETAVNTAEEKIEESRPNPTTNEKGEETQDIVADPKAIAYYDELKKRGYVSEENEFKGTWEELDEYFDTLPQQVLNSVVETMPDISKDVMKFIATAGNNITKDEMKNFFKTYFEDQESKELLIETNDDARMFLAEHYKTLGMKDKAITAALDQLEDDQELLDEAKEIAQKKTSESKTQKLIQEKESQNKELLESSRERARLIQEELQQTGWKKEKLERVSTILSKEFNSRLSDIVNSPKALIQLADFLDMFNSKEKQFDLTSYKNQNLSTAAKSLKDKLEKEVFSSATIATKHNTQQTQQFDDLVPEFD